MIRITNEIYIGDDELEFGFIRSSGPGGQNVNKVSTAVQLRFDAAASTSIPEELKERLRRLAGRKMTSDGILIIESRIHRSQLQNRDKAIEKFTELLRKAAEKPVVRKKTKPSAASRQIRLEGKRKRSEIKKNRGPVHLAPED